MSTHPDTTPDLAERLVQGVAENMRRRYDSEYDAAHLAWQDFAGEAREDLAFVLRGLVERPRHGGPHMYCRSEGELRGLINEIEGANRG